MHTENDGNFTQSQHRGRTPSIDMGILSQRMWKLAVVQHPRTHTHNSLMQTLKKVTPTEKMGKNNFQPVRKGKDIVKKWKKETHAQSEMEEGN